MYIFMKFFYYYQIIVLHKRSFNNTAHKFFVLHKKCAWKLPGTWEKVVKRVSQHDLKEFLVSSSSLFTECKNSAPSSSFRNKEFGVGKNFSYKKVIARSGQKTLPLHDDNSLGAVYIWRVDQLNFYIWSVTWKHAKNAHNDCFHYLGNFLSVDEQVSGTKLSQDISW